MKSAENIPCKELKEERNDGMKRRSNNTDLRSDEKLPV